MNFWKQIPNATRIYLVILIYLVFLLCGLIFLRQSRDSSGEFFVSKILMRFDKGSSATSTFEAFASLPTQTYSPQTAWLRARTNVQIYQGPGSEYPSVAWLESDQTSEIIGVSENEQWWAIKLPYLSEGRGWVSAEQVEPHNVENVEILENAGESPIATTTINLAKAKAISNINIRSGPDLKYRKIGTLEIDQSAVILAELADGYWWLIKVPGTENLQGWISKDYAVAQNADNIPIIDGQANSQTTLTSGSPFLTANATVNIRSGPDITSTIIGTINQGQVAEIVGRTSDGIWWAISFSAAENQRGWVAAAYVKAENAENVPVIP